MLIVVLWSALRLIVCLIAAIVSIWRPMNALETNVGLWPIQLPWQTWLERLFISPMIRWDVHWYIRIIEQGYQANDGTAAFHPLFPGISSILSKLGLSPILSLLLVSSFAGLAMLYLFERLANLDCTPEDSRTSVVLLLFSPLAFTLFIPYTESMYLLFAVLCLYWARKGNWWLAGFSGGLSTLTRQQGLFLIVPLAWELWEASERNWKNLISMWRNWLGISLVPAGMLFWIIYRGVVLNDISLDIRHPINFIYNILISPSASEVVPVFRFLPPWETFASAMHKLLEAPDIDIMTNLLFGLLLLVGLIFAWQRMRISYRLFSLAITLVALSDYTGPIHPYMGLPRHIWLAFPIFIGLAPLVNRPWKRLLYVTLGFLCMLFLVMQFTLESWVP